MFAYRLGEFVVIGPEPSAQEELVFLANEATKHLKQAQATVEAPLDRPTG